MEMRLGGGCNGANFMADLLPNSQHIECYEENPFNLCMFHFIYLLLKEIQTCVMQLPRLPQGYFFSVFDYCREISK